MATESKTTAKQLEALETQAKAFVKENGSDIVDSLVTGASLLSVVANYKELDSAVKEAKDRKFWRGMARLKTENPDAYEAKLRKVLAKQQEIEDAELDAQDDETIMNHQIGLAKSVGESARNVVGAGIKKLDKATDVKGVRQVKNVGKGLIGAVTGLTKGLLGKD